MRMPDCVPDPNLFDIGPKCQFASRSRAVQRAPGANNTVLTCASQQLCGRPGMLTIPGGLLQPVQLYDDIFMLLQLLTKRFHTLVVVKLKRLMAR